MLLAASRARRESVVYESAAQALNWQAAWVAAMGICALLNITDVGLLRLVSFIGMLAILGIGITATARAIRYASRGRRPGYPFRLRLVPYAE